MASSLEVSQPNFPPLGATVDDNVSSHSNPRVKSQSKNFTPAKNVLNEKPDAQQQTEEGSPDENKVDGNGNKGNGNGTQKMEVPKAKIFDNKNFVEAPLPKTNPWLKNSNTNVPHPNTTNANNPNEGVKKTGETYYLKIDLN